jgi:alpha-tubulin suppressor-like RCC1 family protein
MCVGHLSAFAIGEAGELFSWGCGEDVLGHGDTQGQPSPKRVEALRGVWVSSVSIEMGHSLALTEDGLVYAWGGFLYQVLSRSSHVGVSLLPKPVEALRGVRVRSIAVACKRSCVVTDTGELLTWGDNGDGVAPLGHGEQTNCPLPKPIKSLRGIKLDAVAAGNRHTLALADDGSVYAWGDEGAAQSGALGLGDGVTTVARLVPVLTPERVPELRVARALWL